MAELREIGGWLFDLHLDVRSATIVAVVMLALSIATRHARRRTLRFVTAASFEVALICALFALWQVANGLTRGHTTGGLARGHWLWDAERTLHVPSEISVQHLILGHPWLVRAANYYYDTAHLTLMLVFLVWLWLRHRDRYRRWRNLLVVFTAMSLLVQMIAVAPPRLLGIPGLEDTAMVYGQSVYAVFGSSIADQYAAMPSIHVGWAVLISVAVVRVSPSRWRWLACFHGLATCFVVVATANHYWLDGVAAISLLGLAWLVERAMERLPSLVKSSRARPRDVRRDAPAYCNVERTSANATVNR